MAVVVVDETEGVFGVASRQKSLRPINTIMLSLYHSSLRRYKCPTVRGVAIRFGDVLEVCGDLAIASQSTIASTDKATHCGRSAWATVDSTGLTPEKGLDGIPRLSASCGLEDFLRQRVCVECHKRTDTALCLYMLTAKRKGQ